MSAQLAMDLPLADLPASDVTRTLLGLLRARYGKGSDRWLYFEELLIGTGFSGQERRIDAWAMDCWPSGHLARTAFEVKATRADWLRELKEPAKRKYALLYSNRLYVLAPKGVVRPDELPAEMGLMEAVTLPLGAEELRPDGARWDFWAERPDAPHGVRVRIAAPYRDSDAPTWAFLASVARASRSAGRG